MSRERLRVRDAAVPSAHVQSRPGAEREIDATVIVVNDAGGSKVLACGHRGTRTGICRDVVLALAGQRTATPLEAVRAIGFRAAEMSDDTAGGVPQ